MAVIGYMRVSCEDQNADLQKHALKGAGCEFVYADLGVSAISKKRPGFAAALKKLKRNDTLVVWKIDRAFRSVKHAIDTLEELNGRGVAFCSVTEYINTTSPMGYAMYQIQNVFAELERKLISERTKAGLDAARRRGSKLGRPRKLTPGKLRKAKAAMKSGKSNAQAARLVRVSARTLRRALDA